MSFTSHFIVLVVLLHSFFANASDFYKFDIKDHEDNIVSLEKYRGKVTLVVNVASQCGYTDSTYKALTKVHDILAYDGFFSVLAFPCNQFGDQEPEDTATIVEAMTSEYELEFPIFDKIDVMGEDASPAFRNLVEQSSKAPEWNFYKYLVGSDGIVLNAWGTRTEIEEIFEEIQIAVNAAKSAAAANSGNKQQSSDETVPESPEKMTREEL